MSDQRPLTYEEALQWIHGLITFGIKPGLKRMEWMLERLGNPERRLKFVHVAGTNGKGSTSSFLATMLHKAGYDVGLYTSPYIERFTNRIKLNGVDIPDEDVAELAEVLLPLVEELAGTELGSPTEFEVVTTMAILYYARKAFPDVIVWETGLGGRLDSTNVILPVLSIITNVGMDHQDYLGHTIKEIAGEKAGIIKRAVPLVTAVQNADALEVILAKAEQMQSTVYQLGRDFTVRPIEVGGDGSTFDWEGPFHTYSGLRIRLRGEHQITNASVAVMAVQWLKQYMAMLITEEDVRQGLAETIWAGRLETISNEPEIIVDGAHNPQGMQALSEAVAQYFAGRRIHLLIGVLGDKSLDGFLEPILPLVGGVTVTKPSFRRAGSTDRVRDRILAIDSAREVHVAEDWKTALEDAIGRLESGDLLLITGSLYLISDIRNYVLQTKLRRVGESP